MRIVVNRSLSRNSGWIRRSRLDILVVGVVLLSRASLLGQSADTRALDSRRSQPTVSVAEAPAGASLPDVEWVRISAPPLGTMLAAVARPRGTGPFPAVLLLHGTHGFAREYVELARAMATHGIIGVAPCWFAGGSGPGTRFVTPIGCPEAPPMPEHRSPAALEIVDALVHAVRGLPGVQPQLIALFGHSRGGGTALQYVRQSKGIRAAILNSAGYPPDVSADVSDVAAPILILHGVADRPADGGSVFTDVEMARKFEAALRKAGKQVETSYFQDGGHNTLFTSSTQRDATVKRAVEFLKRRLPAA